MITEKNTNVRILVIVVYTYMKMVSQVGNFVKIVTDISRMRSAMSFIRKKKHRGNQLAISTIGV